LLALIIIGFLPVTNAQDLNIKKATTPIKVDGIMDEGDWDEADIADSLIQNFPTDTARGRI